MYDDIHTLSNKISKPVTVMLMSVEPTDTKTYAVTSKDFSVTGFSRYEQANCRGGVHCHVVCGIIVLVPGLR
jgi:hypothetical protein